MSPDLAIPNVIYSLWFQGRNNAPPIVQLCFQRWEQMNSDFEMRILDMTHVIELLKDFPLSPHQIQMQALSDIVRIRLLLDNGGVWVDATLFPVRPLSEWLHANTSEGFFAFEKPGVGRPIASWFLCASRNHTVLRRWWVQIESYWSKPRKLVERKNGNLVSQNPLWEVSPNDGALGNTYPYFWFHYLFGLLLKQDPEIASIWERCPKISAVPPHALQFLLAKQPAATFAEILEATTRAPVQKLRWQKPYPLELLQKIEQAAEF